MRAEERGGPIRDPQLRSLPRYRVPTRFSRAHAATRATRGLPWPSTRASLAHAAQPVACTPGAAAEPSSPPTETAYASSTALEATGEWVGVERLLTQEAIIGASGVRKTRLGWPAAMRRAASSWSQLVVSGIESVV